MEFFRAHLLTIITFLPAVGAALLLLPPFKKSDDAVRWFANAVALLGFFVSLPLWFWFDLSANAPQFQFPQKAEWIPSIGVSYHFGVDGISVLLILLTTMLGFIGVLCSWTAITERVRQYYIFLLLLQTGMLGVFCALDVFLFYVFWEVMLVPMYFLIGIWGGVRRLYAAIKFFLYTLVGSVVMLLGILALYFHSKTIPGFESTGTFDVTQWYAMGVPSEMQTWAFLAFFLGFAIKVPMFPFHTWLPDAHVEAPTAGSVILAGVLLKMGTYGFVRFSLPILPEATLAAAPWVVTLSLIAIVYAGFVTLVQKDMKKLIAYSSVSHMGFVMLGMFALNPLGLQGSVLQMLNHGLSTGGLFLLVGMIYERRHTKEISQFGGLAHVMPVYATFTLVIFLASMGMPLLNGFVGEFLILQGAYSENPVWAYWAVLGIVLGAAYLLWLYQRVFWGKIDREENRNLVDLNTRELATLVPLVVLCFWIGLYPKPFLAFLERPATKLAQTIQPELFASAADVGDTSLPRVASTD
jgi:NADH-quinone oxidoreductase subunit M